MSDSDEIPFQRKILVKLEMVVILMFYHVFTETQVLSYDGLHIPDCLAVTAAGIAV